MLKPLRKWLPQNITTFLYIRKHRLERMWSILRTPYWRLAGQDYLNDHRRFFKSHEIKVLAQEGDMDLLEMEGLRLYWPQEYQRSVLNGSYTEIFEPSSVNPHAYEVGNIQIQPGDWVVDAGACEGFFTFWALQRGANVLMIEPVPRLASALARTFAADIEAGKVKLIQAGLGETPGEASLSVDPNSVMVSKIDDNGQENVAITSLDQLVNDGIIPRIDFVKMDIEGFEIAAIKGATRILKEQMPTLSLAVYHEFDNARLLRDFILEHQPRYQIRWRGILLLAGDENPRPFMLLGHA